MTFIIAMACFTYAGITIFRYIESSFNLLKNVRSEAPDLWESLGRPEKIWVRTNRGGMYTIKPLWPWLDWVWRCESRDLDRNLGNELKQTSQLLRKGLIAFGMTFVTFFYVIIISPPA